MHLRFAQIEVQLGQALTGGAHRTAFDCSSLAPYKQKSPESAKADSGLLVRVARLELAASWSQTRRPTNWATPGYSVKRNCSLWSNMWSRKFYHIFTQLSTEVIKGNCEDKREYATFREVEPIWCSSSQTRRPTNWATPGNIQFVLSSAAPYSRFAALSGCKQNGVLQHPLSNWATPGY